MFGPEGMNYWTRGPQRWDPARLRQEFLDWLRRDIITAAPRSAARATCIEWPWSRDRAGYGQFAVGASKAAAHRWVYTELVGPIKTGLLLRHRCDNPPCGWTYRAIADEVGISSMHVGRLVRSERWAGAINREYGVHHFWA